MQGTMPSSTKSPSRLPMWNGVKFAYLIIALCLFPLAIAGYWAYGNSVRNNTNPFCFSVQYNLFLTRIDYLDKSKSVGQIIND